MHRIIFIFISVCLGCTIVPIRGFITQSSNQVLPIDEITYLGTYHYQKGSNSSFPNPRTDSIGFLEYRGGSYYDVGRLFYNSFDAENIEIKNSVNDFSEMNYKWEFQRALFDLQKLGDNKGIPLPPSFLINNEFKIETRYAVLNIVNLISYEALKNIYIDDKEWLFKYFYEDTKEPNYKFQYNSFLLDFQENEIVGRYYFQEYMKPNKDNMIFIFEATKLAFFEGKYISPMALKKISNWGRSVTISTKEGILLFGEIDEFKNGAFHLISGDKSYSLSLLTILTVIDNLSNDILYSVF